MEAQAVRAAAPAVRAAAPAVPGVLEIMAEARAARVILAIQANQQNRKHLKTQMIKKTAAQITVLTAIHLAIPMVLVIRIMPVKQTARMIPKVLQAARNS